MQAGSTAPLASSVRVQRSRLWRQGLLLSLLLTLLAAALPIASHSASPSDRCQIDRSRQVLSNSTELPIAQRVHPLPGNWAGLPQSSNHYLEAIAPSRYGYLVWAVSPLCIYIEPASVGDTAAEQRQQQWQQAVNQAVADWRPYFDLQLVSNPAKADISIWRRSPPLRRNADGQLDRARTAETSLVFYREGDRALPRYRIDLGLTQGFAGLVSTARHELGHAFGLWGHSDQPEDVMYVAQSSRNIQLTDRDLGTLRHLYQQPTQLGWPLPRSQDGRSQ
ncbi:matrixin family metalloprotease [Synechococcus elongatus]|uniref:matrixin family metalloprotease n=1 Tax=Synechococcus elongatus TaxID=32046 RepID=UPI000F7E584C|nr:matrixin family metalloprotease [Synechococcus elongatus]